VHDGVAWGRESLRPVGEAKPSSRLCQVYVFHDQGHIPVKLLAGRNSAALSIGSGLLFSSVGHGSAFDIAGRGIAKPEAVLRSIQLLGGASHFGDAAVS
jgi:4-hydroxy-L-threonine phosphate dehydrogenase PdxA